MLDVISKLTRSILSDVAQRLSGSSVSEGWTCQQMSNNTIAYLDGRSTTARSYDAQTLARHREGS